MFDPEADYKQPPPYYGLEQKHKYDLFTNGFIIHENTVLQNLGGKGWGWFVFAKLHNHSGQMRSHAHKYPGYNQAF